MAIKVMDNGPLVVDVATEFQEKDLSGMFTVMTAITDQNGNPFDVSGAKTVCLCRCGLSSKKPFCDGKHTLAHMVVKYDTFDSVLSKPKE